MASASTFLYDGGVHLLHLLMRVLAIFSPKIRTGLEGRRRLMQRLERFGQAKPGAAWFHVASSGEMEQAIPVMDELKKLDATVPILLTYFSPSGKKAAELETARRQKQNLAMPWDHADYLPPDDSQTLDACFRALAPKLLALVHRELWPGLLTSAKKFGVPATLISTFWPNAPSSREKKKMAALTWTGTVDRATAEKLSSAAGNPTEVIGDPRAERVMVRKAWNAMRETQGVTQPLFLLASLHEKDVAALRELPLLLKDQKAAWVVVPHEPTEGLTRSLRDWLSPLGPVTLWSETNGVLPSEGALIVDKVGFLAELYVKASVVLVGGSYFYRVHNVWEPAAYAKPILTGSYIFNSAEALELKDRGLLFVCPTAESVASEVTGLLTDRVRYDRISSNLAAYLQSQSGISRHYAEKLLAIYRQPAPMN